MHPFQDALDIRGEVQRLGNDDEIELAIEPEILARHDMESPVRQPCARRSGLVLREIDACDIAIR